MPSTISAGTTAGTALNFTSDTTGNLAFQTNGTTTAMTIDTSQNVTFANNVTYSGTITAGNGFSGSGAGLSSINASNVTSGTLASARLPSSGINAASITTGTLAVANGGTGGLLPVANGGTGTSSPSLVGGTNITISGAWPNQTVTAAGGGVTSLNGQTGAITNTSVNSIGSYFGGMIARSATSAGSTVAGSSLRWSAGDASNYGPFAILQQNFTQGNLSLTGTWRAMGTNLNTEFGCGVWTTTANLWVRIS